MKKVTSVLFFCFILPCVFLSCASGLKNPDACVLHGLVIDEKNNPVCGYEFSYGADEKAITNENGFFSIDTRFLSDIRFSGKKMGFEKRSITEKNIDFTNLYVYKVSRMDSLFSEIEDALEKENYAIAENIISLCTPDTNESLRKLQFYKSIIAFKTGDFVLAKKTAHAQKVNCSDLKSYIRFLNEKIKEEK